MTEIAPDESQQDLIRWKKTLVSAIDAHLRKHDDKAIPNEQGAIPAAPGSVDLLLWKGCALQYIPKYVQ